MTEPGDDSALQAVLAAVPEAAARSGADQTAITVPAAAVPAVLQRLRDDPTLAYDMLLGHTAVDRLAAGTFELIYLLYSLRHGRHLMVSATIPREHPEAPTVSHLFRIAEWQEREVYDLFGVLYDGHPDLRRLLLEDTWTGHPLRKDYRDDNIIGRTP